MSLFGKVTVIGIGLIGSSLARVIKRDGLARRISCYDVKPQYMQKALELGIVDEIHKNIADSVKNADLIVLSAPLVLTAKSSEKLPRFSKMTLSLPTSDQSKNMSFGKLKPICRPIQKFRSFPGTRWQEPKNQAPKPALTHCLKGAGSL